MTDHFRDTVTIDDLFVEVYDPRTGLIFEASVYGEFEASASSTHIPASRINPPETHDIVDVDTDKEHMLSVLSEEVVDVDGEPHKGMMIITNADLLMEIVEEKAEHKFW